MDIERWFYSLPLRLRSFFHPSQVEEELKEELREHLEEQIKENVARGMSPEEARYSAMRTLGGTTQIEQQCRDARGASILGWLCSGFALRIPPTVPQPGLFCAGNSVLDPGHRCECRSLQLGRRALIPPLSCSRAPRATVCPCGNSAGRNWSDGAFLAGLP